MTTAVDLANEYQYGGSIFPAGDRTSSVNGEGVDFRDCEAAITVDALYGPVTPGTTCIITLQESDDDGDADAYANITGATMATVSTASANNLTSERLQFQNRAKRWVRAVATLTGSSPGIMVTASLTARKVSY